MVSPRSLSCSIGPVRGAGCIVLIAGCSAAMMLASATRAMADMVILDDTWADGTRTNTALPNDSATYASLAASVSVTSGPPSALSYTQSGSSQRLWTYFAPNGSPITLGVGDKLLTTIEFVPRGTITSGNSRNFRFGLFNDPTSGQVAADGANDAGGTGNPWADSRGYSVKTFLSTGPANANAFQIGKRTVTDGTQTSLLGSDSAYTYATSGGAQITYAANTLYTMTFLVDKVSATQTDITTTSLEGATVRATQTVSDNGTTLGAATPYDSFDQLFFRFSSAGGTADTLEFRRFRVELLQPIPEASSFLCLGAIATAVAAAKGLRRRARPVPEPVS